MQLPDRVTVPTCIGCGAMSQFGTCDRGCAEDRLDLVDAVDYDGMVAVASEARTIAEAYRGVVEELASGFPEPDEWAEDYRALQRSARAVLRRFPLLPKSIRDPDDGSERATAWWCERCGGIDAPQPCLGICVWRPIEWVNARRYDEERAQALDDHETEVSLHALVHRIASITPREGYWERGWRLFHAEAQLVLAERAQ